MTKDDIQKAALNVLRPLNRGGVGIATGGGKTLVGLRHMNENYNDFVQYLVVAPKVSIFDEWRNQAKEHGLAHLIKHMRFTTYLSLDKQFYDYDVIYLDECHSLLSNHEPWLNGYQGKIIGLTGTAPKFKTSEKGKMVEKFCPIVFSYITDTAVKDKILNDYRIIVHMLPLDNAKNILVEHGGKSWYTSEQATYDYWTNKMDGSLTPKYLQIVRVMRMKAMMDFPSKEVLAAKIMAASKNKILLFANTQAQADRLCRYSYHSNNPESEENLRRFKDNYIDKLSCVLQLSEGVNIPNLKEGIIMHSYGNERKSAQRIGRMLRLNPKETATIHVLCYANTVDEKWVADALESFNQSKISYKL